jgi:hypothetical protein
VADPTVFKNGYVAFTTSTASTTYVEVPGVKSISLAFSKAQLANGVMGDSAEVFHPGLISVPISLRMRQDFTTTVSASGGADKLLWNLWNNETKFTIKVRAVDAAVSGTNPSYKISPVGVFDISPINAAHGELLEHNAVLMLRSPVVITRSTST